MNDNILTFPAHATDLEPRNIAELVTSDGEVYELYQYCGEQYLRYTMDGNDGHAPAHVIPLPPSVLTALANAGSAATLPHGGTVA